MVAICRGEGEGGRAGWGSRGGAVAMFKMMRRRRRWPIGWPMADGGWRARGGGMKMGRNGGKKIWRMTCNLQ